MVPRRHVGTQRSADSQAAGESAGPGTSAPIDYYRAIGSGPAAPELEQERTGQEGGWRGSGRLATSASGARARRAT